MSNSEQMARFVSYKPTSIEGFSFTHMSEWDGMATSEIADHGHEFVMGSKPMGRISDATNIRTAFVVPLVCYVYIFYFAVSGYRAAQCRNRRSAIRGSKGTGIMICRFCLFASLQPLLRRFRD
jgi:hypothetical protein